MASLLRTFIRLVDEEASCITHTVQQVDDITLTGAGCKQSNKGKQSILVLALRHKTRGTLVATDFTRARRMNLWRIRGHGFAQWQRTTFVQPACRVIVCCTALNHRHTRFDLRTVERSTMPQLALLLKRTQK
jgi:hypothetical protein